MLLSVKKEKKDYSLQLKSICEEQVFMTASIINKDKNPLDLCKDMYNEIVNTLNEYEIVIFHERIFGSLSFYEDLKSIRNRALCNCSNTINFDSPFTFLEGKPHWGAGLNGIIIHGIISGNKSDRISNIKYGDICVGRIWKKRDSEYLILHSINGLDSNESSDFTQSIRMFERANHILREYGFGFGNVVRTWIYLHDILEQYNDFNKARNFKFRDFGLIPNSIDDSLFEQVYMPASTGIDCNNQFGASGIMDIFAVRKVGESNLVISSETGRKQKSAYRYGSAFSRAVLCEDEKSKVLYLSGTASINDNGDTVHIGDVDKQIESTFKVVKELLGRAGFEIDDMSEGTVFLKKAEYVKNLAEYCQKHKLLKLPWIITVADVCRDNLLFEIDSTFVRQKSIG